MRGDVGRILDAVLCIMRYKEAKEEIFKNEKARAILSLLRVFSLPYYELDPFPAFSDCTFFHCTLRDKEVVAQMAPLDNAERSSGILAFDCGMAWPTEACVDYLGSNSRMRTSVSDKECS